MQVCAFNSKGLPTGCVSSSSSKEMLEKFKNGECQLIFFTPEALLECSKWRKLLRTDFYASTMRVVVVDEAHTAVEWYKQYIYI